MIQNSEALVFKCRFGRWSSTQCRMIRSYRNSCIGQIRFRTINTSVHNSAGYDTCMQLFRCRYLVRKVMGMAVVVTPDAMTIIG